MESISLESETGWLRRMTLFCMTCPVRNRARAGTSSVAQVLLAALKGKELKLSLIRPLNLTFYTPYGP